jgi:Kef-type K+ transport system membrane component KefB
MLAGVIALFVVVQHYGEQLSPAVAAPERAGSAGASAAASNVLWHVLLALAVVVVMGRLLGEVFRYIGQPPVIGEVVGGIVLGPSLLGHVAPAVSGYILPSEVAPFLGVLAQLGVIVYMFLVGLELNTETLRGQLRTTVAISHASIAVPFALGSGLALYLYPRVATAGVPFTHFALFLGVAMSITAFPVLARIVRDIGLSQTSLGTTALTCAALDDVVAWCLLAVVVGFVNANASSAILVTVLTVGYAALMFIVVRPMVARMVVVREQNPTQQVIAIALVGLLLSAWVTESIGIHAIFGAFLFGVVIPHQSHLAHVLRQNLESLTILLLPAFFAFTGMRTEVGLLSSGSDWIACAAILAVATAGKWGATLFAARLTGLGWRESSALGVLMNTRGLMELIVLNVGLELGVISRTLFTMMVLMALATTVATTPLLRRMISFPEISDGRSRSEPLS